MFHFLRQWRKPPEYNSTTGSQDQLGNVATEMALDIIQCNGSERYRQRAMKVFDDVPSLISDVDPKYQAPLKQVLSRDRQ